MSADSGPQLSGGTASAAAGAPPLGTITGFVRRSKKLSALEKRVIRFQGRCERYQLLAFCRQILPKERVRHCFITPSPFSRPHLKYSPARKTAHLAGLMVCGSPWSCPLCAARISERRRAEVADAVAWAERQGLRVVLATFTLSHGVTDSLEASLAALNGAYRRMQRRRDFAALRASHGLRHTIKAVEVTWSPDNGFHPHLHVLYFVSPVSDSTALHAALTDAWLPSLRAQGFSATKRRGVDVRATWNDVQDYVTKLGRTWGAADELTKANTKRGRKESLTPWDLLRSAASSGNEVHANRFREFALTMKGTRQLRWSPGFKAAVGIEDRDDEDIAANWLDDDQLAYVLAWLDVADWAAIRFCGPEAMAELEALGDKHDREGVAHFLADCRSRYFAEGWGL